MHHGTGHDTALTGLHSRRSFLGVALGATAVVLSGCAKSKPRNGSAVAFLGDDAAPGSPIWAADPGAYVIAVPEELAVPAEAVLSAGGALVVLNPACPLDRRRVGWCPSTERFVCPQCSSVFDATGTVEQGPAQRGLGRYRASETTTGELSVDSAVRRDGDRRGEDVTATATRDPSCAALRFPPEPTLAT